MIIGAGGHGKVVAEVAAACGYDNISFLDDNREEAIGKINEMKAFCNQFANAFVGIGNNQFRNKMDMKFLFWFILQRMSAKRRKYQPELW